MKTSQIGIQQNTMTKDNTDAIEHDDKQNIKTKNKYAWTGGTQISPDRNI